MGNKLRAGAGLFPACLALAAGAWGASVSVDLEGLEGDLKKNVEASLSIKRPGDDPPAAAIRRMHARASDEIKAALQPYGYYAPEIEVSLEEDGDDFRARYTVKPGEAMRVSGVEVEVLGDGAEDPRFQELAAEFPLKEGDVLDHALYTQGKNSLQFHAAEKGYLEARYDSSAILVNLSEYKADVVLHYDSGKRYTFGDVRLHQDVLNDNMVRGYVDIQPGDPYERSRLLKLQRDLTAGPYYSTVEIHTQLDQAEGDQVPIDVVLVPAKPRRYEVGAGYGTDTGFRGQFGVEFRRLNRRGHYADGKVEVSEREVTATTRYHIPWPYPKTEKLTFFAGLGTFDPDWSYSRRLTGGISLSHMRWGWREVFSIAYEFDDWTISDTSGETGLLLLTGAWSRVRTDDRFDPANGYSIRLELRGCHDQVLSDVGLFHATADFKFAKSLFGPFRSIYRIGTGALSTTDFQGLPPGQRFVTGGDQTVRGYSYESLGPKVDGRLVGGNLMALGSAEVEYRFLSKLGLAAFVDAGNAFDGSFEPLLDAEPYLNVGVGTGLRWISPVGLIRLDGAWGISIDGNPFHIHFMIGPVF